jgi:hypothetical protein
MQAVKSGIADDGLQDPFTHSVSTRQSWMSVAAHAALHDDPEKTWDVYVAQQTCAAGQSLRSSQ